MAKFLIKIADMAIKVVLHGTTCNNDFSRNIRSPCNMVLGTIFAQKLLGNTLRVFETKMTNI